MNYFHGFAASWLSFRKRVSGSSTLSVSSAIDFTGARAPTGTPIPIARWPD